MKRCIRALRVAAVLTAAGISLLAGAATSSAFSFPCPSGQVPNWNNNGCMPVQSTPYVPSGIGTQQSVLPQSGPNGAPALRSCNGSPTPIGQPCPGDPQPQGTTSVQPAITVSPAPTGAGPIAGPVTQSSVSLQSLLGDWYTGWMSYLSTTLNWSDANQAYIASIFGTVPACEQGQQAACEQALWVQILPWYLLIAPGANVSVSTPAPPPTTASSSATSAAATTTSTTATPAASSAPTVSGESVDQLLGDWYSGWLAYTASALNWSDDQTAAARAYFNAATPCSAGQKDACQAFVMQQLDTWLAAAGASPAS